MISKILVAIDGSESAWKGLDLACDLATQYGAEVIALHVVPYEPMPEALRAFASAEHIRVEEENARFHYPKTLGDNLTREAERRARVKGVVSVAGRTDEGRPADSILATAAEEGVDMIVVGCRGLSDAKALVLGSVSHRVANHARCTCLTVK